MFWLRYRFVFLVLHKYSLTLL
ncbi:hypothetical protein CY0110_17317 [Crocosphaera chwakensis CCY0110]|uniref:Uncharacterized protein n=1 Tax=Crocosphaera chwakensis CCY0110 TaxID=391612 RepID=A3IIE5_9CHRO|nr:hypothetical protein CY0110_17317 [Crocosphaera chwakensis CCY0110]